MKPLWRQGPRSGAGVGGWCPAPTRWIRRRADDTPDTVPDMVPDTAPDTVPGGTPGGVLVPRLSPIFRGALVDPGTQVRGGRGLTLVAGLALVVGAGVIGLGLVNPTRPDAPLAPLSARAGALVPLEAGASPSAPPAPSVQPAEDPVLTVVRNGETRAIPRSELERLPRHSFALTRDPGGQDGLYSARRRVQVNGLPWR